MKWHEEVTNSKNYETIDFKIVEFMLRLNMHNLENVKMLYIILSLFKLIIVKFKHDELENHANSYNFTFKIVILRNFTRTFFVCKMSKLKRECFTSRTFWFQFVFCEFLNVEHFLLLFLQEFFKKYFFSIKFESKTLFEHFINSYILFK